MQTTSNSNTSSTLVAIAGSCFGISVWAMAPGWMTNDSISHLIDARAGVYRDMFPVLLAWIWNKLLVFSDGPLPMLAFNLTPYWLGFYFLAEAARTRMGRWAAVILLLGFWPGIFEQAGFIWKDIIFGSMMLFSWSVVISAHFQQRNLRSWEKAVLPIALMVGVGVKPNGITALPFLFGAWFYVAERFDRSIVCTAFASIAATIIVTAAAFTITIPSKIVRQENFMWQYTEIYDLLGISASTGDVLLPPYITAQTSTDIAELRKEYWPGGVPSFFFRGTGSLATNNRTQIHELSADWLKAVKEHPMDYLHHRWENLAAMLRIGAFTPAWVGEPGILQIPGMSLPTYRGNIVSENLGASIKAMPWAYLPWVYGIIATGSLLVSLLFTKNHIMPLLIAASSAAFFAPHFFILPAADYRYLYFCYLMAFAAFVVVAISISPKTVNPE